MKKISLLAVSMAILPLKIAYAQAKQEEQTLRQIVETAELEAEIGRIDSHRVAIEPELSYLSFNKLVTETPYFRSRYSDSISNAPQISLKTSWELPLSSRLIFEPGASAGISYFEGAVPLESMKTAQAFTDFLKWTAYPLSGSAALTWYPFRSGIAGVHVGAGAGAMWVGQTGTLDGTKQNFWIPTRSVFAGLRFFGSPHGGNSAPRTFDGVELAVQKIDSFSTAQRVSMLAFSGSVRWTF